MSTRSFSVIRLAAAAAACGALIAVGLPSALAAPTPTDAQGYVDSTARCTPPNTVVLFGSTERSRVAICESPSGEYEYRGVRLRDGARLIAPAEQSTDGGFTVDKDGITYFVTEKSLTISAGNRVIRDEPMVDFHQPQAPAPPAGTPTPTTPLPPPLPAEVGHTDS